MNAIAVLIQTIQAEPLGSALVQGASALILGLQAWNIRTTTQIDRRLLKIETAFTGLNGTNGAVGTLKEHTAKFDDVYTKLGEAKALAERRHRIRRKADSGRDE